MGIDVSHHQGSIDWNLVSQAGTRFAFIKATEGVSFKDSKFSVNRKEARSAGLNCGFYHFFRPRSDVARQADNFINSVGKLEAGDLPPVLDLENPSPWFRYSKKKRLELIASWIGRVEDALGVAPIIYLSPSFAVDTLGSPQELSKYLLWIAHYTSRSAPRVPSPWTDWTFWQYTETGTVSGVSGNVDRNRFNGDETDFDGLLIK